MPRPIRITDVAPRDGLQNERAILPTAAKARLVRLLAASGVHEVELTSFVRPDLIPQLADAADLLALLAPDKPAGVSYSALVPNERGMLRLLEANAAAARTHGVRPLVDKVNLFTAASETFNKKNTNASIAESIDRFRPVVALAREQGLAVMIYISCCFACPYEGPIAPAAVASVIAQLVPLLAGHPSAAPTLAVSDTIGAARPEHIAPLLAALPVEPHDIALHLHDTFGHAAACVRAALFAGVRAFDGSVAGLGGCPFASTPGHPAPGNVNTALLVRTIEAAGEQHTVDPARLAEAADFARSAVAGGHA